MVDFSTSYEENFERSTGINYLGTKNQIDTKKYNEEALETLTTKDFVTTLKDYYEWRDGESTFYTGAGDLTNKDDADIIEYFYNDRTWRNNNTVSMSRDLSLVMGTDDDKRLKQFAKINNVYQNLPNFWNDPNRDFRDWLLDFGGALVLDPVNLIGFGVGGQAAKQAYKQEMKILLKGKMANKINDKIFEEASKAASKKAFAGAVGKGALYEGLVGGAVTGASDVILQNTAIKSGVQEDFDYGRLGVSTAFAACINPPSQHIKKFACFIICAV